MTSLHTLASGSSGNSLLLSCGKTHILVDAGISCRRITASLRELGLAPGDLSAIFITHIHKDHISGLQTLLKHTAAPVVGSGRTCRELIWRFAGMEDRVQEIPMCCEQLIGSCRIVAFPISHDAPGACGYRIDTADGGVGILTDTGYVTKEAAEILPGAELVVLEANHDVEAVCSGSYPYYLKKRILGVEGHLCNEDAARFAVTLAKSGTTQILLAHLSKENNTPAMARNAVERALCTAGLFPELVVAPRDQLSECFSVGGRRLCKE